MGYTTEFEGQFRMDKLPSADVIVKLRELEGVDGRDADDAPGSYNQWQLTKDCQGIEWDGNEKFYEYEEWLQYLINNILHPAGVELSGAVAYSGEDVTDVGLLMIEDGKVVNKKTTLVAEELGELKAFKEYVLKSRFADEIVRGWQSQRRAHI